MIFIFMISHLKMRLSGNITTQRPLQYSVFHIVINRSNAHLDDFQIAAKHKIDNPVCSQCYISKAYHQIPTRESNHFTVIPTIHDIGETIIDLILKHPNKNILFLISACEMTLEMFQPWSRMTQIKGIGIRLGGRICNTMKAFDYSERGIKPGLTTIRLQTQRRINQLLERLRSN